MPENWVYLWGYNWNDRDKILWENIPNEYEKSLRDYSKIKQSSSECVIFPSKHKYVYVLGKDKRETRELRKEFESLNTIYEYPKERGK